ncbi:MAG TPA: IS21 family transposase [Candidatus Saccharimonadia bacterium]|nr:IS21 family transposase [Candidatus Saccharimonadia bacterium]
MIDYSCFCQVKHLHVHQGLTASQIAKAISLDRRTVAYWLAQEHFRPRKPRQAPSKLDLFKPDIVRMLERYPYSAAQIFQRLHEHGFDGSYALVKAYVRTVRPRRQAAFLTLAFAPGECAQVDWGSFGTVPVGQTHRQLSFFVMVLCYSRMLYVEFTVSQTMEHFLACHQHAFDFFGGIPHKVMVHNLKSAVLKRAVGDAPVLNPKYLDFATHHGFTIAPCNVGKGHEKGRVENGVGYVKKNFLAGLEIPDFSALNPAARYWLDTVANVRMHGETRAQPTVLWHTARPAWRPVPLQPFAIATGSQGRASRQFRVTVETNRYSVPAQYAGHALTWKTSPDRLCLSLGEQLIARHVRRYDRHTDVEDPDHPKALLEQRKKARDHKLFMRFLALSPRAEAYYLQLEARRLNPHHHVRKIVALSDIYAPEAVARAMEDAFGYEAFSSAYIANLVEQRARCPPEASALHLTRRSDLLDVRLAPPDLRMYSTTLPPTAADTPEGHPHG